MEEKKVKDDGKRSAHTPTILCLLNGLCRHFGKMYCFPSQLKIMALLEGRFTVKMSRATLNRHLLKMVDNGMVQRKRRIRYDKVLGTVFNSTLYEITLKGYEFLMRCGINCVKEVKILRSYLKKLFQVPDKKDELRKEKSDLETIGSLMSQIKGLFPTEN